MKLIEALFHNHSFKIKKNIRQCCQPLYCQVSRFRVVAQLPDVTHLSCLAGDSLRAQLPSKVLGGREAGSKLCIFRKHFLNHSNYSPPREHDGADTKESPC